MTQLIRDEGIADRHDPYIKVKLNINVCNINSSHINQKKIGGIIENRQVCAHILQKGLLLDSRTKTHWKTRHNIHCKPWKEHILTKKINFLTKLTQPDIIKYIPFFYGIPSNSFYIQTNKNNHIQPSWQTMKRPHFDQKD